MLAGFHERVVAVVGRFDKPALVTAGTASPPFFAPIVDLVAAALRHANKHVFEGAGHVPHLSHTEEYVDVLARFIRQAET
jgi:pimeloyl-ACP methyl ester carboxylesterase